MSHQIFTEIEKFNLWAQSLYSVPQDNIGGEWECDYTGWQSIYNSFQEYITSVDPKSLTPTDKDRLLYIIARDNEVETLADLLNEQFLTVLAEYSISNGRRDDKWQLSVQLHKLTDREKALSLLEEFVNDEDEYVNRRSLIELAELRSNKVEMYAEKFWHKDKYGELEEYQKIAALHALKIVGSKLLGKYVELAKQSGQRYLMQNANKMG